MSIRAILAVLALGNVGEAICAADHLPTDPLAAPHADSSRAYGAGLQPGAMKISAPRRVAASTQSAQCEGPGVDPWVTDLRDRIMMYSEIAHFAVRRYGPPTACDGEVTTEFEGDRFGRVVLTFAEGVTLFVETMPPETSITTFRAPGGFEDAAEVRSLLREYASGIGLSIDWTAPPEVRTEGAEVVHRFWDPEPGLNASASLIFLDGTLVGVCLSVAL